MAERIEPAMTLNRFNCPSCDELTDQVWFNAYLERISNPVGSPLRIAGDDLKRLSENPQFPPEIREQKVAYWNKVNSGEVFIDRWAPVQTDIFVAGMEISVCRACMEIAVWLGGRLAHPVKTVAE